MDSASICTVAAAPAVATAGLTVTGGQTIATTGLKVTAGAPPTPVVQVSGVTAASFRSTVGGATGPAMQKLWQTEQERRRRFAAKPTLSTLVKFRASNKFDVEQLPKDLVRVFKKLEARFNEDYALHVVFTIRTAVELHRAWHMTLLTSTLMDQLKEKFNLRMTWHLGVLRLKFHIEDGEYELQRKVPYDYDSEYQDKYMRIATALIEGRLDVHKALTYQIDTKQGKHTAPSGLFLRDFPGRLILYPLEAATCAVIFFGGDWTDAWVAALCGFVAGCIEWGLNKVGRIGGVLLDALVGTSTGAIAGLCFRHLDQGICLSSVFMGTLYWFFYGTAFVIGLLEIIAGELETGVTRFIAVSVKTFVLCLGAGVGMVLTLEKSNEIWTDQKSNCGLINLDIQWYRIPLYLLCSASALGQYRFPILDYWRGLVVQLVAYEVQYQSYKYLEKRHESDNMDYALSNVLGAMAAVVAACVLELVVEKCFKKPFYARILYRKTGEDTGMLERCMFWLVTRCVKLGDCLGLGRKSEIAKLEVEKIIQAAADPKREDVPAPYELKEDEEDVLVEAIVGAQNHNLWAVLMPAVYQLVPGSMIAKLWFNTIFPPSIADKDYERENGVYSNLMVISTSLAIGLLLGFAAVQVLHLAASVIWRWCCCSCNKKDPKRAAPTKNLSAEQVEEMDQAHEDDVQEGHAGRLLGMFTAPQEDPSDVLSGAGGTSSDPVPAQELQRSLSLGDCDETKTG